MYTDGIVGSRDTGSQNRHRKRMVSDIVAQSQLSFAIKKIQLYVHYVAVLGRITLTMNIRLTNLGMPANSGEPKAMKDWLLAFAYMLLMSLEFLCEI